MYWYNVLLSQNNLCTNSNILLSFGIPLCLIQMTPIIVNSVEALVDVFQGHADTDKSFELLRYNE